MKKTLLVAGLFFSLFSLAQRGPFNRNNDGQSNQDNCMLQYLATTPIQDLTEVEIEFLTSIREEEKLARDVYLYLYEVFGERIFTNIAKSEQQHMNAILVLLERYSLTDPIVDDTPGLFQSEAFASLYTNLTQAGSASLTQALTVGATIEDLDINDLMEGLEVSDNDDLDMVYQNLMKGSRNHLRAFTSALARLGETYVPQYLTQEEVDAIITTPMERRVVYDAEGLELEGCSGQGRMGGRNR